MARVKRGTLRGHGKKYLKRTKVFPTKSKLYQFAQPRTAQIVTRFAIAASKSVNIAACGFSVSEQPLV
jgi:hypothetical protein